MVLPLPSRDRWTTFVYLDGDQSAEAALTVAEAARNLAGVGDAGSEEFDHEAGKRRFTPVVYHLKEWVQGNAKVQRKSTDDKGLATDVIGDFADLPQ